MKVTHFFFGKAGGSRASLPNLCVRVIGFLYYIDCEVEYLLESAFDYKFSIRNEESIEGLRFLTFKKSLFPLKIDFIVNHAFKNITQSFMRNHMSNQSLTATPTQGVPKGPLGHFFPSKYETS